MVDQHTVTSTGVHLNVITAGDPTAETIVLLHGFPDNHHVWDSVVALLSSFRVVAYDVRGAGESTAPAGKSGYAMPRLVDDFVAVLNQVCPGGQPVHLVGHDWGSVQGWEFLKQEGEDARLSGRIASYTSISGPALDIFGHFVRSSLKHGRVGALLRQLAHSWYIGAFQLPRLPELAFGRFGSQIRRRLATTQGLDDPHWTPSFASDGACGVNLYRANRLGSARWSTNIPVQLIVPTHDAFLTPAIYADAGEFASHLKRIDVLAGHWVPRTHPDLLAQRISEFVAVNS